MIPPMAVRRGRVDGTSGTVSQTDGRIAASLNAAYCSLGHNKKASYREDPRDAVRHAHRIADKLWTLSVINRRRSSVELS